MEYALLMLPYILRVPPRKTKPPSNDEAAQHLIQLHAASVRLALLTVT